MSQIFRTLFYLILIIISSKTFRSSSLSGGKENDVTSVTFIHEKTNYDQNPRKGQWYYAVNVESGRALETPNNRIYGSMTQWYFHGSETQEYQLELLENGLYKIIAKVSGGVLQVKDFQFQESAVETEDFKNSKNQLWDLSVHASGAFYIHPQGSAACLCVTSSEPGTNVVVNECQGGYYLYELWFLVPACQ